MSVTNKEHHMSPATTESTPRDYAEVVAGVRHAIAAYCHAVDDGRVDDVIALFAPEGVSALPDMDPVEGHDALRALYGGLPSRGGTQRHLVVNTAVSTQDGGEVGAISDLVVLGHGKNGWRIQLVGRYEDVLREHDGRWCFASRSLTFANPVTP
jgi:ketosteroid isomerase-like protein